MHSVAHARGLKISKQSFPVLTHWALCYCPFHGLKSKTAYCVIWVESDKSFDQASSDLESAVGNHGFGVLHVHDLGATLRGKGIEFDEQCKIFEVCNPGQAAKVLSTDMRLNMALPCRISVFTEKGKTKIGLIKPRQMLSARSQDAALVEVAKEVEEQTIQMVDEAK